jgi:hypothetical protein
MAKGNLTAVRSDIEDDVIKADARLRAIGDLLACASLSEFELDRDHLLTIGTMIAEESARAKSAFDTIFPTYVTAVRLPREATNG